MVRELATANRLLELRRQELDLIVDQAPVTLWAMGRSLRVLHAAGPVVGMLGTSRERIVGTMGLELLAGEADAGEAMIAAHRAVLAGERRSLSYSVRGRDFGVDLAPLRDAAGTIIGVVGVGVDVTERRQLEEEARASEERLRQLAENVSDALFVVSLDRAAASSQRSVAPRRSASGIAAASPLSSVPERTGSTAASSTSSHAAAETSAAPIRPAPATTISSYTTRGTTTRS